MEKKLKEEEVQQIISLKKNRVNLAEEFKQLSIMEIELKSRKTKAEEFYHTLNKFEKDIGKNLTEKYGDGTVDIEKGIIITKQ